MEPWPTTKFDSLKALANGKIPAVVLAQGALSPAHKGHVQMLYQAKERLERAGYQVLAGWLLPQSDYVPPEGPGDMNESPRHKRKKTEAELSAAFRMKVAELCVEEDEFVSISPWEVCITDRRPNHVEATSSLLAALKKRYKDWLDRNGIRAFYVCGCGQATSHNLMSGFGSSEMGVVVCPRKDTDEILLEKKDMFVLVADEPKEEADLSSAWLRQAIKNRDWEYLKKAFPAPAARYVLTPKPREYEEMKAEFDKLGIVPAVMWWQVDNLPKRAREFKDAKNPAVICVSASMAPIHRGHLAIAQQACERLSRVGYEVLAGWVSPAHDLNVNPEEKIATLSSAFRMRAAELAVCSDDFLSLGSREITTEGREPSPCEVMTELQDIVGLLTPDLKSGIKVRAFLVCSPSDYKKRALRESKRWSGFVIVPGPNEECLMMESDRSKLFVADPLPADQADFFDVPKLQAAISSGDVEHVVRVLPSATARFITQPTPEEFAAMQADYEALGVAPPGVAASSRDKLKDSFRSWAGPSGTISCNDVVQLLQLLDPSWTVAELTVVKTGTSLIAPGGSITSDELVDWIYGASKQVR